MANPNSQASSSEPMQIDTDEMDGKYLTFWTDNQLLGIPIAHVIQIVGMQKITAVPEFPDYAKGIISLRGSIIPLIDIRLRLHKPEAKYNERTCIIITDIDDNGIGFIVDEVDSVVAIEDSSIAPPPKLASGADRYIKGIGSLADKIILLMDTANLLGGEELDLLKSTDSSILH